MKLCNLIASILLFTSCLAAQPVPPAKYPVSSIITHKHQTEVNNKTVYKFTLAITYADRTTATVTREVNKTTYDKYNIGATWPPIL